MDYISSDTKRYHYRFIFQSVSDPARDINVNRHPQCHEGISRKSRIFL
jgi:hypothetical protein